MPEDRPFRRAPRTRATLRVRIAEGKTPASTGAWATIRDLSTKGAFLCCDTPLSPGARLRLLFEGAPGEEPLELEAEVKWTTGQPAPGVEAGSGSGSLSSVAPESSPESLPGLEPGAGIAFVEPSPATRRRIHELESQGEVAVLELYEDDEPI